MKIIVLTPVKNEGWILEKFLSITSLFADHIIIADQNSTDDSKSIAKKFPKVLLIENNDENFNESERQKLLIQTARENFPGPKVVFALDADEIISADSLNSESWRIIKNAAPNTVLSFIKPNLYLSPDRYVDPRNKFFPLGFIDDDKSIHHATLIHSTRVPSNSSSIELHIKDICFLHLAYLRPNAQRAKFRFYSMQENLLGTNPWYRRRRRYRSPKHLLKGYVTLVSPEKWFKYPLDKKYTFENLDDGPQTWHDLEILNIFKSYGCQRFWLDDIWDLNWQELANKNSIKVKIRSPFSLLKPFLKIIDKLK